MPPYDRLQNRIEELVAQGCEYDEAVQEALGEINNLEEDARNIFEIQQSSEWNLEIEEDWNLDNFLEKDY